MKLLLSQLLLFLLLCLFFASRNEALDNGVALTPPMGWSSWNSFRYNVSHVLILEMALSVVSSGLLEAGYEFILIDDGWPKCDKFSDNGGCLMPTPRDSKGRITVDGNKFPYGMKALSDQVHSLGLKLGIYTAVSKTTCGGFTGSLGYETIDAQTFADWGMDFVKHDTCNYDCGIHDGCIQNSTAAMRDGLNVTGRRIVYYVDDGNPSSGPRIHNPFLHHVDKTEMIKIALIPSELAWSWAPNTTNMWKSWFDIDDLWLSTLDNLHHMIHLSMYQQCGAFNTPDMLTIGQGHQTQGQYRAQMFLWSVLGAPLILGNDIRKMDNFTRSLLTSPEILAVDQDPECVQGSIAYSNMGAEIWIKPLHDGTFAAVLLNTLATPQTITLLWGDDLNGGYFWPAKVFKASVRDLYQRRDLGTFDKSFSTIVPGQDAVMVKISPIVE